MQGKQLTLCTIALAPQNFRFLGKKVYRTQLAHYSGETGERQSGGACSIGTCMHKTLSLIAMQITLLQRKQNRVNPRASKDSTGVYILALNSADSGLIPKYHLCPLNTSSYGLLALSQK